MKAPKENNWVPVSRRLPNYKNSEFWFYRVVLQCFPYNENSAEDGRQKQQTAKLEFLGNDPNRPVWLSPNKNGLPIENSAWAVTHWRYMPILPKPLKKIPTLRLNNPPKEKEVKKNA